MNEDEISRMMKLAGIKSKPAERSRTHERMKPDVDVVVEDYGYNDEPLGADDGGSVISGRRKQSFKSELDIMEESSLGADEHIMENGMAVCFANRPNEHLGTIIRKGYRPNGNPKYLVQHSDPILEGHDRWYDEWVLQEIDAGMVQENRITPEKYYSNEFMQNELAGGINKPKKMYRLWTPGDNPMAAETQREGTTSIPKTKKTKVKEEDRSRHGITRKDFSDFFDKK